MVCSLEAQGLFSIIKCLYWQKECVLSIRQIKRRYDRDDLISELVEEGCIKVDSDDMVGISFLNEQFETFHDKRKKLSEAGKKGVLSKKNKATLKPPLSQDEAELKPPLSIKNREEENREDKSIEEEIRIDKSKRDNKNTTKKFSDDIISVYDSVYDYFPERTRPKTIEEKNKWLDEIRKLIEIDKIDSDTIVHLCKLLREDSFWIKNFQSIMKLRQKNKEGIKYIDYFIENFKHQNNDRNNQTSEQRLSQEQINYLISNKDI